MNTKFNATANDNQINDFLCSFVPFGWLDMRAAVEHALNAGKDAEWAAEQVTEFADQVGVKIDECDPVYCVMDSILQAARGEIESLTGYDFLNDMESGSIDTYGNFMCTDYDYTEDAKEELLGVLAKHSVVIEDMEEITQYFLYCLEIDQDDINAAKQEEETEEDI